MVNSYQMIPRAESYRLAVVRELRTKNRPHKLMEEDLSIKIELDLEVEVRNLHYRCWLLLPLRVDLYERVKEAATIRLL